MSDINVLFTGSYLRWRRRMTILNPPSRINFYTQQDLSQMGQDANLSSIRKSKSSISRIKDAIFHGLLIPDKHLKGIDLIYSPGKLVLNSFPHVIEIDNPACLTYYNLTLLSLLKPLIKKRLESSYCKAICCLSEAAKKSVLETYGGGIKDKLHVVYPYIESKKTLKKNTKPKFLFVSTSFYIKGGRQLLDAWQKQKRDALLTILSKKSDIEDSDFKRILKDPTINFVEANLEPEQVSKNYFATHDVLVVPTMQDSFGMVFLEALAHGMVIITTDIYNLPELVEDGKNGFLLKPPFYYFDPITQLPNKNVWDKERELANKEHKEFSKQIDEAISRLIADKTLLASMQKESSKLFKQKFSPDIRQKKLQEVLMSCVE